MIAFLLVVALTPPVARRQAETSNLHGVQRTDDYAWLRHKGTPEVEAYLKAENAYSEDQLKPTAALQKQLYDEALARLQQKDETAPFLDHGWLYSIRTEEGKAYPIFGRKRDGKDEVIADLNLLGKGHKFIALGGLAPSIDGRYVAYSTDVTGFRDYTLYVKDMRTGQVLSEQMPKTETFAFAADNKTLFYVVEDAAKRAYRLYRHVVGTGSKSDVLVYEEKDERFVLEVERSLSDAYILLRIASHTTSEVRYLDATKTTSALSVLAPRIQEQEYDVGHAGDLFYIRVNDKGRNFRLVTAPVTQPDRPHWKELLAERDDVMLEGVDVLLDFYVLWERVRGVQQLTLVDRSTGKRTPVPMGEQVYALFPDGNRDFTASAYRYGFTSFVTPKSVYEADAKTGQSKLLKRTAVLGNYDPNQYTSERIEAVAKDGVKVPISVVYKKGTRKDGTAPMLLRAYGSYGMPYPVTFAPANVSLLDRGMMVAVAHIRGGGDLGKKWHDAGRMLSKKTTFTDFIACAEHLIAQRYTRADRLAIEGGSAGGLLMGAVTNMRPDLFRAVVALVPFVDVVNTMLDTSLPLTVGEFEEWGNPKEKAAFDYMLSYSPYDNVTKKAYPALLVKSAYNDSQVMYFEPAKWVAKLRANKTDQNPLLLLMDMDPAGHGGKSDRFERLREQSVINAFVLWQLGVAPAASAQR